MGPAPVDPLSLQTCANLGDKQASSGARPHLQWVVWPGAILRKRGLDLRVLLLCSVHCPDTGVPLPVPCPLSLNSSCPLGWGPFPRALSPLQPHLSLLAGLHSHALGLPRGPLGGGKTPAKPRSRHQH